VVGNNNWEIKEEGYNTIGLTNDERHGVSRLASSYNHHKHPHHHQHQPSFLLVLATWVVVWW